MRFRNLGIGYTSNSSTGLVLTPFRSPFSSQSRPNLAVLFLEHRGFKVNPGFVSCHNVIACSHNTPDKASIPPLLSVNVMESANWTSGPARILATTTSKSPSISSAAPQTRSFLADFVVVGVLSRRNYSLWVNIHADGRGTAQFEPRDGQNA